MSGAQAAWRRLVANSGRPSVLAAADLIPQPVWKTAISCGDMLDSLPCKQCGATRLSECKSGLTRAENDATRDYINVYGWRAASRKAGEA